MNKSIADEIIEGARRERNDGQVEINEVERLCEEQPFTSIEDEGFGGRSIYTFKDGSRIRLSVTEAEILSPVRS